MEYGKRQKAASRERRSKVAEEEERYRKEAEEADRQYRERVRKREADKQKAKADAAARKRAAVSKANAWSDRIYNADAPPISPPFIPLRASDSRAGFCADGPGRLYRDTAAAALLSI
jgi:hypothetical protein